MKKVLEKKSSQVYHLVASIPLGKVSTYGDIAALAHLTTPRSVGYLLHYNPDPDHIPCHRVVNAQGKCAKNFAFGFEDVQKQLLKAEGISFIGDRVDMKAHRWNPFLHS